MGLFRFKKRRRQLQGKQSNWRVRRKRSHSLKFKQRINKKFWIFLGTSAAVVAACYAVFFTPVLTVQNIEATTEYKDVKTEDVEAFMADLVLNKNTLLITAGIIEEEIYEAFPEVSSVVCGRNIFRKLFTCNAYGYELVAVIKHEGERYYINENGVIIAFDSRKLGLPILDLILNPVFSNDRGVILTDPKEEVIPEVPVLEPQKLSLADLSPTASILRQRSEGTLLELPEPTLDLNAEVGPEPEPQPLPDEGELLTFIQPDEIFLIQAQSLIEEPERDPFEVEEGKKILDTDELKTILESINQLENDFKRKVSKAQYVQVAGELSLKSKYIAIEDVEDMKEVEAGEGEVSLFKGPEVAPESEEGTEVPNPPIPQENPDHELEILLDLKRDLNKQFKKLRKAGEVINFAETDRIDLSIEGKKVFYR
ncbi:MAG: hypothetical protein P1V18_01165 [Candidatus Gracilibacteria bacterium]|nr:hypothetical protein [Candidatus Gracilibacteria bacterium]